jgi:hypothetical protein
MKHPALPVSILLTSCLLAGGWAHAQVAGSTTTSVTVTESTQLAMGWSVKKTLLGKTIYNDADQKIGQVIDLIISPERDVSYVIVGAGGFIGIGRHDVAIAIRQIRDHGGKLVMAGATKGTIESLPAFHYANDADLRTKFVADADRDISRARAHLLTLQQRRADASVEVKAALERDIEQWQRDLKNADETLNELKRASANRWHRFESSVAAATARLRKGMDAA